MNVYEITERPVTKKQGPQESQVYRVLQEIGPATTKEIAHALVGRIATPNQPYERIAYWYLNIFVKSGLATKKFVPATVGKTSWVAPTTGRMAKEHISQREMMRRCYKQHGPDREKVIDAYARAEERGEVKRESNVWNHNAEEYGNRLYYDGDKKGWL